MHCGKIRALSEIKTAQPYLKGWAMLILNLNSSLVLTYK